MTEPTGPAAPAASTAGPLGQTPNVVPELEPVRACFDAGDVRTARAAARTLLAHPKPEVAAAARAFLTDSDTDPMAFAAALTALGVLALVASAYLF